MTPTRIAFRADGNARIGLGHLTRCQALAELLVDNGWQCLLLTREDIGRNAWFWRGRAEGWDSHYSVPILRIPAAVALADEPAWLAENLTPADILVLDGYSFNTAYQLRCKQQRRGLVCFDDFAASPVWADVIINMAGGVTSERYANRLPGTQLCLGPSHALLRPAFWQVRKHTDTGPPDTSQIFLSMGGADPDNHTLRLAQELHQHFPQQQLHVVTGAAYPYQAELLATAADWLNVTLHHNLPAHQMAELLHRCGVYVCPPSGLAYECCAIGGLLLLQPTADNQQLLFDFLTSAGLALRYPQLATLTPEQLPTLAASLRQAQRAVFDPQQIEKNYRQVFRELEKTYHLQPRRATATDATLYFNWANDPAVRANAIHPEPITWLGHLAWFGRRLADPDSYLYVFAWEGRLVGQVRIEFDNSTGIIDYSIDAEWRGRGLGLAMLRRALVELWYERPGSWQLHAEVQAGNVASARVFERLHFSRSGEVQHGSQSYEVFALAVNSGL